MKKMKSFVVLTVIFCMLLSMGVFAMSSDSIDTPGYITLKGTLSGNRSEVTAYTSVEANPDNAYLYAVLEAQDRNGNIVKASGEQRSPRGNRGHSYFFYDIPSNATIVYGTLGVKGGNQYKAEYVYVNLIF